jgi:hypothetical protein
MFQATVPDASSNSRDHLQDAAAGSLSGSQPNAGAAEERVFDERSQTVERDVSPFTDLIGFTTCVNPAVLPKSANFGEPHCSYRRLS